MKSHRGFSVPLLLVIIMVLIVAGGVYAYQKNKSVSVSSTDVSQPPVGDDFTPTFGQTYAIAKKELAAKGWTIDTASDQSSANDKQFPEIGGCGSGIDAICFVNFIKEDIRAHLDVQIGGRPPYGPYSEWTVVGND